MHDLLLSSVALLSFAGVLGAKSDLSNITIHQLENHITQQEAAVAGVIDGAQKLIRWYDAPNTPTDTVILYFHGYSASRQEIDPVPKLLADALGANIFYTRFKGHGITGGGVAFKGVTFEDWIADAEEAMQIARILGKKVIIIAHSNGAVMAMHLMQQYPQEIVAGLFVAPNFRPTNRASTLLTNKWGYKLATLLYKDSLYGSVDGDKFTAPEGLFPHVWSNTQHLHATQALAIGVKRLQAYPVERMRVPLFVIASDHDKVVETSYTKKIFMRYGVENQTAKELRIENHTNTQGEHTITGDMKAPHTSKPFAQAMLAFIHAQQP